MARRKYTRTSVRRRQVPAESGENSPHRTCLGFRTTECVCRWRFTHTDVKVADMSVLDKAINRHAIACDRRETAIGTQETGADNLEIAINWSEIAICSQEIASDT